MKTNEAIALVKEKLAAIKRPTILKGGAIMELPPCAAEEQGVAALQTANSRYVAALWQELLAHSLEPFEEITGVITISYERLNAALKKTMPHCT